MRKKGGGEEINKGPVKKAPLARQPEIETQASDQKKKRYFELEKTKPMLR